MMELHICNQGGIVLRAFALGDEAEVIIGRDDSCDIQIRARSISREHCAIERENGHLVLRDLGSSGGTRLEGEPVERVKLHDGIEVQIGPAVLKFFDSGI